MNKRIRFEETETHMNLWVGELQFASILKAWVPPGYTPFQWLCTSIDEQGVLDTNNQWSWLWYLWLEQLYNEGKLQ